MTFLERGRRFLYFWLPIIGGPIAALIFFAIGYWLDPFSLKEEKGVAAFFVSVLGLLIGQWWATVVEIQKSTTNSEKVYDAIKNYLHVTPVGSPEEAMRYIADRLPALREVQNTRLNIPDEVERSNEKLYESDIFDRLIREIPWYCKQDLIWKDIGDNQALPLFRKLRGEAAGEKSSKYKYKLLAHVEPQMNFILLEYRDGAKEVLFNWDFRSAGQDPTVLISRDRQIVEMFAIHYTMLWRRAAEDHDNQLIKSTSTT